MSLRLADRWLWDFWLADDGELVHALFLQAPRSLGDPDLRHVNATVGHAVSHDLRTWEVRPSSFGRGAPGAFDDRATWTGSVLRHEGRWLQFYTGVSTRDAALIQRIGLAVSTDLEQWERTDLVLTADPRWYQTSDGTVEEHWRDPWAFVGPDGAVHLLITAMAKDGPPGGHGVIGHAWSDDLLSWHVGPPLSTPGRFRQIEVPQLLQLGGRWWVLASSGTMDHPPHLASAPGFVAQGGSYLLEGPGPLGPFEAVPGPMLLGDDTGSLYAARAIRHDGAWHLLAWRHLDDAGQFAGELVDPIPLEVGEDGRPRLAAAVPRGTPS